jgi:hypothetical protein
MVQDRESGGIPHFFVRRWRGGRELDNAAGRGDGVFGIGLTAFAYFITGYRHRDYGIEFGDKCNGDRNGRC